MTGRRARERARGTLLGWAFERLYGALAPCYDSLTAILFAGQWKEWQAAALRHVRGNHVVELGSGTGTLLLELSRRGLRPIGVEPSPRMRAVARRKLLAAGFTPTLIAAEASSLPLPDESASTVVSTFPSDYILDACVWRQVARVLRPGGCFVIVLGGTLRPWSGWTRLLAALHRAIYGGEQARPALPEVDGLRHAWLEHRTRRGVATLVVATRTG